MATQLVKGFGISATGASSSVIEELSLPLPLIPAPGQVCVRVRAASVNPIDSAVVIGLFPWPHLPAILGFDFAGEIESVGENVEGFRPGDRVAGCSDGMGALAERVHANASCVTKISDEISFADAASVPLVALTAYQALEAAHEHLTHKGLPMRSALLNFGAGGVGSMAVQFAKLRGLYVAAITRACNREYLQSLGADVVIERSEEGPEAWKRAAMELRPELFDCVIEGGRGSSGALVEAARADGGVLVAVSRDVPANPKGRQTVDLYCHSKGAGSQLADVFANIASGKVRIPKIEKLEMNVANVRAAMDGMDLRKKLTTVGKIVLTW